MSALGERRILTAASLREAAGLRLVVLAAGLAARLVGVSVRGARPLLATDFDAADRAAGPFAVRVAGDFAAVLRVVAVAARLLPRAVVVALAERVAVVVRALRVVVADFTARAEVLRVPVVALEPEAPVRPAGVRVVAARVAAGRVEADRVEAGRFAIGCFEAGRAVAERAEGVRVDAARPVGRLVAARLVVVAVLAGLVFLVAPLATLLVAAPLAVRVAGARVVLARVVVAALVAREVFGAAFGLAPGFFAAGERVDAVAPLRVDAVAPLRVVLRALVPAVRLPPARTAMARLRVPSVLLSLLIVKVLCLI
ncbi:MAG: hypothetical protein ACRYG4_26190 [Janthinobacterium lividum]